jgi:hypothetical protein
MDRTILFLAIALASTEGAPIQSYTLSIGIYAGLLPSNESNTNPFLGQLRAFAEGKAATPPQLIRILDLEHPAVGDFDLLGEGTADGQKRSVNVHVTQSPDGKLLLQFQDLGGPSQSFFSHNRLLIGPGERQFLRLADTPGSGGKALVSVVLVTTTTQ